MNWKYDRRVRECLPLIASLCITSLLACADDGDYVAAPLDRAWSELSISEAVEAQTTVAGFDRTGQGAGFTTQALVTDLAKARALQVYAQRYPAPGQGAAASDGVVELQLTYAAFFGVFEKRAHSMLHDNALLGALVTAKSQGALTYHDTVLSKTRIGAPTALTGAPRDDQLLLQSDIDVVTRLSASPSGAPLQHLTGSAWIMLTPDNNGVTYALLDGFVNVPGQGAALPIVEAGSPSISGRFDYPALGQILGVTVLRKGMAHHTFGTAGDAGVVAFRFSTRRGDDLDTWPGDRISGLPSPPANSAVRLGLLRLPAGLVTGRLVSALTRAIRNADDHRTDVTDGACCSAISWNLRGPGPYGQIGDAHAAGVLHVHWEVLGASFSARVDIGGDVAFAPSIRKIGRSGELILDSVAQISWNTNSIGIADGFINDEIKRALEVPPDLHRESEGDHSVVLKGTQVVKPPAELQRSRYENAYATQEGILATLPFGEPAPEWKEVGPTKPLCGSQYSDAKLTVVDANNPSGPAPDLLYPPVVDPPMPLDIRTTNDAGRNGLTVRLSFSQIPADREVTVTVVTDIGAHTWRVRRPIPIDIMSPCTLPDPPPTAPSDECWACGEVTIGPRRRPVQPVIPTQIPSFGERPR